jgi:hypothetical protein
MKRRTAMQSLIAPVVIAAASLALTALSFAAPTVTFQSMPAQIQPTQCSGQVCTYPPQIIAVDIEGLPADVGYSDPYFATIMLSSVVTTQAPNGASSQTVFSMQQAGLICGIPAHCEVTNPGTWSGYVLFGPGTYSVIVNLYRGDGAVQAYAGCGSVASDNCNTAGTLVASTPVPYTFTLAGPGAAAPAPAAPVSSAQGSPCETAATPGSGSITDQQNVRWTISAAPLGAVQRNDGGNDGGFWASQILWTCVAAQVYAGGSAGFYAAPVPRLNARNKDNGSWAFWNGSKWVGL